MVEEEVEVASDTRDDGEDRGDDERGESEGGKVGHDGGSRVVGLLNRSIDRITIKYVKDVSVQPRPTIAGWVEVGGGKLTYETGWLHDLDDPLAHPSTTEQGHDDGDQSRGSVNGFGEEVPDLASSDQPSKGRDADELAEVLLVELVKLGRDCTGLGEDLLFPLDARIVFEFHGPGVLLVGQDPIDSVDR